MKEQLDITQEPTVDIDPEAVAQEQSSPGGAVDETVFYKEKVFDEKKSPPAFQKKLEETRQIFGTSTEGKTPEQKQAVTLARQRLNQSLEERHPEIFNAAKDEVAGGVEVVSKTNDLHKNLGNKKIETTVIKGEAHEEMMRYLNEMAAKKEYDKNTIKPGLIKSISGLWKKIFKQQ